MNARACHRDGHGPSTYPYRSSIGSGAASTAHLAGDAAPGGRAAPLGRPSPGQSVVEFALTLPLLLFLMVAVVDLARIYTTMLSVESAAREAADFGTFGSQKWNVAIYNASPGGTEASMERRACVAASDLPDYVGPDDDCTNPTFAYQLSADRGATWVDYDEALACDDPAREPPCWVKVTLEYDFDLLIPFNLEIFGASTGCPTRSRSSAPASSP